MCNQLPLDTNVDRHNDRDIYSLSECSVNYNRSCCENKYNKPDCLNSYFSVKPFSVVPLNQNWINKYEAEKVNIKDATAVTIQFSHQPNIIYAHTPQLTIVDLVFSIGETLGLWIIFYVVITYAWKKILGSQNDDSTQKDIIHIQV